MAFTVICPGRFLGSGHPDLTEDRPSHLVDNLVMPIIPGAMDAGLVNPIFWLGMMLALTAAFIAAFPVNRYLIDKGKRHRPDPAVHARRRARRICPPRHRDSP